MFITKNKRSLGALFPMPAIVMLIWMVALLVTPSLVVAQEAQDTQAAQEADENQAVDAPNEGEGQESKAGIYIAPPELPIEEVVVIGRYKAAATDIVSERMDSSVPVDMLDAESISRVGDGDVAAALRRVPGLTLVQDKFVYVRGLGERYSSAQLNSANVPSPDLTRNVLPLDIFPAEIVDALSVSKAYSPELPASFGGGNIDIRTKRVPEDRVLSFKLNTGLNSQNGDDGFTYRGGDDDRWGEDDGTRALPGALAQAINTYQGSFSPSNVLQVLNRDGGFHTIGEAEAINRDLAVLLNRDVDVRDKDLPVDVGAELTGGYRWFLGNDWEFGFLGLVSYGDKWRNRERINRRISNPETDFSQTNRTVRNTSLTGSLNLGVSFLGEHEIGSNTMYLRNTEDEAAISLTCAEGQFNDCADGSPSQGRIAELRYEQRELEVQQLSGSNELGYDTLDRLPEWLDFLEKFALTKYTWFWSDSTATTDIPSEVRMEAVDNLDPVTRAVLDSRIRSTLTAGKYTFSDLEDEVESNGWDLTVPFAGDGWDLEFAGGYDYSRKVRSFDQLTFGLGSTDGNFATVASGTPSQVFSDANIADPNNGIGVALNIGQFGEESYAAAQIVEASWGKFDLLLNETWRIAGGARYEDYVQVSIPLNLLAFGRSRIGATPEEIREGIIATDEYYPSLALTYIRPYFWADEFQFRVAWSETVARPDIREVTESIYIDPLTEARVQGRSSLRPSDLTNFDIRAEWLWESGDSFTVSAFLKEIDAPIETVQGGASEDNILFTFVNGERGEISGIEVEGLKNLGFLGDWGSAFYVAGNATFSDSELDLDRARPGAASITNDSRRLTQHSEWVLNLQLGWDSFDAKHAATLVYNAFGERIFFAGIDGNDDAFEQPFHSLDLVYSWYPTENLTLKVKLQNLLDQKLEIDQRGSAGNVTVIEQDVGTNFVVDLKWEL
ncbi:MAG: TonB-dependent receptor plug domain-containing protein [Pseudomonadota bacterium]